MQRGHRPVEGWKKVTPGERERRRERKRRRNVRVSWEGDNSKNGNAWRTPPRMTPAGVPEPALGEPGPAQHCTGLLALLALYLGTHLLLGIPREGHWWHGQELLDSKAFQDLVPTSSPCGELDTGPDIPMCSSVRGKSPLGEGTKFPGLSFTHL